MPTNDERREVAAYLRNPLIKRGVIDGIDLLPVVGDSTVIITSPHEGSMMSAADLLADLIEPEPERTCRNVSDDKKWFTCSECGSHVYGGSYNHSYVDESGVRWYTTANKPGWNYCPNCGAMVIEEDR